MKHRFKLILCACMAIGSIHYVQAAPKKGGWKSWFGIGKQAPKKDGKRQASRGEPFMTDRSFYRRAFVKPEKEAKRGPRDKEMVEGPGKKGGRKGGRRGKKGGRKGRRRGKWGKKRRSFFRKAKMASELKVAITDKQRQDWDELAKQINGVADRAKAQRDAMRAAVKAERKAKKQGKKERKARKQEKKERKARKQEKKKHKKMMKKQLAALPDYDRLLKEKRQLEKEKRILKKELFDVARKYIGASDSEKKSIKQKMIEFQTTKMYPLNKKLMQAKHEHKMLKFKFYETDAAKPMVTKVVERTIQKAERRKVMWPLRKEYR